MRNNLKNLSLVYKLGLSLLFSAIIFNLQIPFHNLENGGNYLILYPIIFIYSWWEGPLFSLTSLLYFDIATYSYIYHFDIKKLELLKLGYFQFSSLIIITIIYFIKMKLNNLSGHILQTTDDLSTIIENMHDGFCTLDDDWNIQYVNSTFEKMLNHKREELIGHYIWNFFPTLKRNKAIAWLHLQKIRTTGKPVEFELNSTLLNTYVEIRIHKTNMGLSLFIRDISARKRDELENLKSKEKLSALANTMPQIVFICNNDGIPEFLNQQWYDYTGMSLKENIDIKWPEVIHHDDLLNIISNWKESILEKKQFTIECRLKNANGDYCWHLVRSVPITNKDGKIENWYGTSTDIHEIRLTQDILHSSKENYENLANSVPHFVWTTNADGYLDFFNERFYDFIGIKKTKAVNQSWDIIIHPDDRQRESEHWKHCLKTGEPYQIEFRLKNNFTNEYIWFLGLAEPQRNSQNEILKWFGSYTNIHEHKLLSEKIEMQKIALENALDIRDEFMAIASHELKTPLTTLKLQAQLFKKRLELNKLDSIHPDKINKLTHQVDKQVTKLNRLVDDMLDISRIKSGQLVLNLEQTLVDDFIQDFNTSIIGLYKSSHYPAPVINCNLQSSVACIDKIRIEQALNNLVTNSIRYGKNEQTILNYAISENNLTFALQDFGIGIKEEHIIKIFDRFEKIPSVDEINGLGLGLSITKKIIEAHGGTLSVISEFGLGSTFSFKIPLTQKLS